MSSHKIKPPILMLIVLLLLSACQTQTVKQAEEPSTQTKAQTDSKPVETQVKPVKPVEKPRPWAHNNFNAVLWMQASAEYKALAYQAFQAAKTHLPLALKDQDWTASLQQSQAYYQSLEPAVIMDIDETVLDNSPYQADLILKGRTYNKRTWDKWISSNKAKALPGAIDWINFAQSQGVKVLFVTNRTCMKRGKNADPCPQKQDLLKNLKQQGVESISLGQIFLKGQRAEWTSEKKSRRTYLGVRYRIIMMFGDDLGDFMPDVKQKISHDQRVKLTDRYNEYWGTRWYMLPNPSYGSWQNVLKAPKSQYLQGQ